MHGWLSYVSGEQWALNTAPTAAHTAKYVKDEYRGA